jgi:hypothetical protein
LAAKAGVRANLTLQVQKSIKQTILPPLQETATTHPLRVTMQYGSEHFELSFLTSITETDKLKPQQNH